MMIKTAISALLTFGAIHSLPAAEKTGEMTRNEPVKKEPGKKVQSLMVKADKSTVMHGSKKIILEGNVSVDDGTAKAQSDRMEMLRNKLGKPQKLWARGNVRLTSDNSIATGERGEFNCESRVGWLEGNVIVVETDPKTGKKSTTRGRRITYYMKSREMVITGFTREMPVEQKERGDDEAAADRR